MGSPFKTGDVVRQIMPAAIEGEVVRVEMDPLTGDRLFLVQWPDTDGDGEPQQKFFTEEQIEMVV